MKHFFAFIGAALTLLSCRSETNFSSPSKKSYEATAIYKNSFLTSEIKDGKQELAEGGRFASQNLTLTETNPSAVVMKQLDRAQGYQLQRQGHDSKSRVEEFEISSAGLLDILLVIDDSKSMAEEQAALGTKLESLISAIKDTSWQIAVISMSDPCVDSSLLIKRGDANIEKKFENAVKKSFDRDATEQGFPMAIQSLQGQCKGKLKPWIRDGSSVGVILVSDEDNCGSDPGEQDRCKDKYGKNAAEMVEFMTHLRSPEMGRIYAIVKPDVSSCPQATGVGTEYLKAVAATGGDSGSICAADYTDALTRISRNVNRIVRRDFNLSAIPDMREFKVEADGVEVAAVNAWKVENNRVTINPDAFLNAKKIKFTYSHDATKKYDRLPVKGTVALDTLVVKYAGVVQPPSAYVYSPSTEEIVFTPIPPDDSWFEVSWREDKALLTRFSIADTDIRPDTLEVTVNGKIVDKSAYLFDGANIDFLTAPTDDAVVAARYRTERNRVLNYDVTTTRTPALVTARDELTGQPVSAVYRDKKISFDPKDIVIGRKIVVDIDYGAKPPTYEIAIPDQPVKDSVVVLLDGAPSKCEGGDTAKDPEDQLDEMQRTSLMIATSQSKIFVSCPANGPDHTLLTVLYKYETPILHVFKVPDSVPLGDSKQPTGWKVLVNGVATKSFTRDQRTFTIQESVLSSGAKVDIEATTYQTLE